MKNIFQKLLMIAIVGSFAFLYSCGEDEEPLPEAPTANASADASEYEEGSTATITLDFTAPGELSAINITPTVDGIEGNTDFNGPTDFALTNTETAGSVTIQVDVNFDAGSEVKLVFDVVDKQNQTASDSVTFSVVSAADPVDEFTAVLLGGQLNATLGSYYNAVEDVVYLTAEARNNQGSVDFLYYFVPDSPGAVIAAPDNAEAQTTFEANGSTWPFTTTENSTRLGFTSGVNFDDIENADDVENAYPEVGIDSRVTGLTVGDVVAFQLDESRNSKYGVFVVTSIDGTSGANRTITIDVKIQP